MWSISILLITILRGRIIIISILGMRKLKRKEVKESVQNQKISMWQQSLGFEPGVSDPEPMLLPT